MQNFSSTQDQPALISLQNVKDHRGELSVAEYSKHFGFLVKRIYYLYNTVDDHSRGHHAHKKLKQCLIALKGRAKILLEKGGNKYIFVLDKPTEALLLPAGYWRVVEEMSSDTILLVLASEEYEPNDYISNYQDFIAWEKQEQEINTVPYIDFNREYLDCREELNESCKRFFESNHYINGTECRSLEQEFAQYCGTEFAVGVANGLEALVLILRAWNIGYGDEVLVAANSFIATAIAVSNVNATPVFVDCDPINFNIDPTKISKAITAKTKAIALTHLYGGPADMQPILAIAKEYKLKILEDSAQAHGALYHGKRCGNLGDAAAFSFYPTKNLGAYGDGGMVTTNDASLAEKIRILANYGAKIKYQHEIIGTNSRLDELQAAFLRIKLRKLENLNDNRRNLANIYLKGLRDIAEIELPTLMPDTQHVWHVFPLRVKYNLRDDLIKHFDQNNIGYNIHYPLPIHLQNAYKDLSYEIGDFPVAELASKELISLPLYAYHTAAEISWVVNIISNYFKNYKIKK